MGPPGCSTGRTPKPGYRPDDSDRRLRTKFDDEFSINLSSLLEWHLWALGSYEEHFDELFRRLVEPGDRCMDIGANIGIHTVRLAKLVGERGAVIAIEPDEGLVHRVSINLQLNNLENVRLIQAAASERGGENVILYRPRVQDFNKGRASLLPHSHLTGAVATVPTVSVDEVSGGPLTLIKIDVEGYEAAVVSGADRTIIALSVHNLRICT